MKKNNIFVAMALVLGLSMSLGSCVSDDSTDGTLVLPELSVKGSDATTLPIYNVYLGRECNIKPEISYDGNEADLQYKWQVGTYINGVKGELKDVGTDPELKYTFPAGGSYYVHLAVTDGKVGQVVEYQVNVNRIFEEGYLLTSTDADGKGNLSFVKILTPEEKEEGTKELVVEHCLTSQNPEISEDGLVKATRGSVTFPKDLTRVFVSTKTHCYFLNPNDFTVITSIAYADLYPGFEASEFMPDDYAPYAYDKNMKKTAHLNLTYMYPYEYSYFKDFSTEGIIQSNYLNYQEKAAPKTFYIDYDKPQVSLFSTMTNNNTSEWYKPYYRGTNFPNTGDLLQGQELLTAFTGIGNSEYGALAYILAKDKSGDKVTLWKNSNAGTYIDAEDFKSESIVATADMAVPTQGVRFVGSPTYKRYFYPVANCIYVYLPQNAFTLPSKDQYAIKFSESEEVTYMETNYDTEELYVATFDKNTQKGNFYIYDCKDVTINNQGRVQAKETHKSCAGRISYLMYKPSIQ